MSSRQTLSSHASMRRCHSTDSTFASDRLKWLSKVGGNVPRGGDETKPQPADPPSFDGVVARTNKLLLSLAAASTSAPPSGKVHQQQRHRAETPPLKAPARLTTCSNAQCSASGVLSFLLHARDECRLDILTVEHELARGIFEETREHGATAHSVASTRETPPLTPAPTTPDLPAAVATAISAINGSRNWNSSGGHVAAAPRSPPLRVRRGRPDACRRRADPHTPAPARRTRPRTPASSSAAAAATRAVDRAALISLSAAAAAFSSASRAFAVARGRLD